MHPYLAEFVGTTLLVLLGNGVVCNVVLAKTKGHESGWIVITAGWGIAVFIGALSSSQFSGAHLNPALSFAMWIAEKLPAGDLFGYVCAQMLGGTAGALLCYLFYRQHFHATPGGDEKLACFCTGPNLRGAWQALFCEALGTFTLVLPIFLMVAPSLQWPSGQTEALPTPILGLGTLGLVPVGLLVFGIGLSLGGTTGYAINPARDLAPRLVHALLPIPGKRDSQWSYALVPVIGPLLGAGLAGLVFKILIQQGGGP